MEFRKKKNFARRGIVRTPGQIEVTEIRWGSGNKQEDLKRRWTRYFEGLLNVLGDWEVDVVCMG